MTNKLGNGHLEKPLNTRPILLVEDNPMDVELAKRALEKCNINNDIVVATNATEALDYLFLTGPHENREQVLPAMVLLDINLPKISGIEVLKQIRSYHKTKNLPVVVLSASKEVDDQVNGLDGLTGHIRKPSTSEDWAGATQALSILMKAMIT